MRAKSLRRRRGSLVVAIALAAGWMALSSAMRETDQASILHGVVRLLRGHVLWPADFYNFDKQYFGFWLVAAACRVVGWFVPKTDVVLIGNATSLALMSLGLFAWARSKHFHRISLGECAALLFTPIFVLSLPFFSCALVSAAFIIFLLAVLRRRPSRARLFAAGTLAFAATASRADAILVLPFVAWCFAPGRTVRGFALHPQTATIGCASALAFIIGRSIFTGVVQDAIPPFLNPKIFGAYLLFGLGCGLLLWLVYLLLLARGVLVAKSVQRRLHAGAGLLLYLAPFAYYCTMLSTPRYLLPMVLTLFAFATSPRGRALAAAVKSPLRRCAVAAVLALLAIAPLFVGLHLPFVDRPRLVLSEASRFPSADGVFPMGALLQFLWATRGTGTQAIDHNRIIFELALRTPLATRRSGKVPVAHTPMYSYLQLAADLQGNESEAVALRAVSEQELCYADSRSVLRALADESRRVVPDTLDPDQLSRARLVSPQMQGIAIVEFTREPAGELATLAALSDCFANNEFRLLEQAPKDQHLAVELRRQWEGRRVVLYGDAPFVAHAHRAALEQTLRSEKTASELHVVNMSGREWLGIRRIEVTEHAGSVGLAVAVLPDYMDVKAAR